MLAGFAAQDAIQARIHLDPRNLVLGLVRRGSGFRRFDGKPEEAMRTERQQFFERQYGFRSDALGSIEYFDMETLRALAEKLSLTWEIRRPWYGWKWHLRPLRARLRMQRPPSRFWILVGRFG